jgi:serine/threonine protein phosphatase 1
MIWECRPSYLNSTLHNKTIIHGHRPKNLNYVKKLISLNSKVLPIDTGCVYEKELGYGYLSALEVNSKELISIPYQ